MSKVLHHRENTGKVLDPVKTWHQPYKKYENLTKILGPLLKLRLQWESGKVLKTQWKYGEGLRPEGQPGKDLGLSENL